MKISDNTLMEFTKFLMGGGINFILNITITYALTEFLGLYYLTSFMIVQIILIVYGYLYNSMVTFKIKTKSKKRFLKFISLLSIFYVINILLVKTLTDIVGMPYLISIIVTIVATTILRFSAYRKLVFI